MIHIACNIDSNFTIHCAVTLTSLFANNRNSEFCVHIIASTLPEADQKALSSIAESYGNKICFYFPEKDLLNNFSIKKSGNRISIATYYRCLLSRILPVNIDKILYMDCDIVVLNDISEFWNTDITQYAIGCIEDIGSDEEEYYSRLQYDKKYSYFNAGVLLINLKYWREHKIDEMCEQYFLAHSDRIRFNDQDLLNALLYKDKLFVPFRWNVQDTFYRRTYSHKVKEHSAIHTRQKGTVKVYITYMILDRNTQQIRIGIDRRVRPVPRRTLHELLHDQLFLWDITTVTDIHLLLDQLIPFFICKIQSQRSTLIGA